jgi:P27 family predicted phage terminase small subunit
VSALGELEMGRRKEPARLKALKGKKGHRPIEDEPKPDPSRPKMPAHLTGEAAAEWERVTGELKSLKILYRVDRAAIAAYCSLWAEYVAAERALESDGLTVETSGREGAVMVRKHPAVAIKNEALRLMRGYLGEFGLSPSARTKVGVSHPRTRPPSKFEKMLDTYDPDEYDFLDDMAD